MLSKSHFCFRLSIALAILTISSSAHALSLDEFLGDGSATSATAGTPGTSGTVNSSAVGGARRLYALKTSNGAGFTRIETFPDAAFVGDTDYSLGYTQGAHTGQGIVTWDGHATGGAASPSGLGGIDLTQDGGDALKVVVNFFDFPSQHPISVTLRLYDATDPLGLKYSDVSVTLNQGITQSFPLLVPFSAVSSAGSTTIPAPNGLTFPLQTTFGVGGSGDVKKVGAVQLILNGSQNVNAPDLTIDSVGTNGRCTAVPNANGKVLDQCGVCLNDPNANKGKDACGVCLYGPPSYVYSPVTDECGLCPTDPRYGHAKDPCGVCFGDGSSCADCKGVAHGTTVVDLCGVCGGDNSTCKDCSGVPNGSAVPDQCGVCGGDNSSCLDCAGVPNGSSKPDACGVCGGLVTDSSACSVSTSCPGGEIDACGVCNGHNRCLDCAGVPNGSAKIDCCGVCGGDGSSCLDKCKIYKLKKIKDNARGGIRKLYDSVVKYSSRELSCSGGSSAAAKERLKNAKKVLKSVLQRIKDDLPDTAKYCDTPYCSKRKLTRTIDALENGTDSMYQMSRKAQYGALDACGPSTTASTGGGSPSRDAYNSTRREIGRVPEIECK